MVGVVGKVRNALEEVRSKVWAMTARVLEDKVQNMNNPSTAFVLERLFPLMHPNEIHKVICMYTCLIMKNRIMDFLTRLKCWSSLNKIFTFI